MKALTLTAPFGSLIAIGAKQIETRSWATSYRGPLAIHAGKGMGPVGGRAGLYDLAFSDPDGYFFPALHRAHMFCIDDLPRGAIVAVCELAGCIPIEDGMLGYRDPSVHWWIITDQERAFGDYTPDRYAWLLANVRALPEPIPAKGALGLWTVDAATEAAIAAQLDEK